MEKKQNNAIVPEEEIEGASFLYITDEEEEGSSSVALEDKLSQRLRFTHRSRNPLAILWRNICANIPRRGDRGGRLVCKLVFLVALAVLICSLGYILYDVAVQPLVNSTMYTQLSKDYQPENTGASADTNYPAGMLATFESLYKQNPDVRGWLTFSASGDKDFLKIDYPVMQATDNEKYLTRDFFGNKNKNGALFFDMRHVFEPANHQNKVLIIYGHNMASGQMFAGLNKLIGRVNNARAATTLTLSTLYEKHEYKVFAAVITDEDATGAEYFSTLRTNFSSDEDFVEYVKQVRARSLYDYPVDVQAKDELVVLSTCTAKSTAKVKNGRMVVFARRVRQGEENTVDAGAIVENDDVIMPMAWYVNQNLPLHEYYTADLSQDDAGNSTTTTTTSGEQSSTNSTQATTSATGGQIIVMDEDDELIISFDDLM